MEIMKYGPANWTEIGNFIGPASFSVFQRRGFAYVEDEAGGDNARVPGHGTITLRWRGDGKDETPPVFDVSVSGVSAELSRPSEETMVLCKTVATSRHEASGLYFANLEIPAGGWYRLELTARQGDRTEEAVFGPFAVGEVFIIAGQSYVGSYNDKELLVGDEQQRVVCFDPALQGWRIANDPLPTWTLGNPKDALMTRADRIMKMVGFGGSFGQGSIWPAAMDIVQCLTGVPVGVIVVSYSATSLNEWQPDTPLFRGLELACNLVGSSRAILWGGGESDAINEVSATDYTKGMISLVDGLFAKTKRNIPWIIAQSTYHPAAMAALEARVAIRKAQAGLPRMNPFIFPGPNTDLIGPDARRGNSHSRHYTERGQQVAASLWANAILGFLQRHPHP